MAKARYMDRKGRIAIRRLHAPRNFGSDFYHLMMGSHWWQLLLSLGTAFLILSFFFAVLYAAGGDCIQGAAPGSLKDCFFFSVQTLATIGYGGMTPKGDYANGLVCIEAFCGVLSFALMSGLMFSKFSTPNSRVLFSENMVRSTRNGKPALQFRAANARGNQLMEAHVTVTLAIDEVSPEGDHFRRLHRLTLLVADSPVFALSFTVTHIIDETSPVFGRTLAELDHANAEFIVTLAGVDSTIFATMHARHSYTPEEIRWDHRLVDTITRTPEGETVMDYSKFHLVEAISPVG